MQNKFQTLSEVNYLLFSQVLRHKTYTLLPILFFSLVFGCKKRSKLFIKKWDRQYMEKMKARERLEVLLTWSQFGPAVRFGEQHFHS